MRRHWYTTIFTTGAALLLNSTVHAADWYVDASASPGGNGTEWNEALTSLSTAIAFSSAGDNILVAEGTYSPGTQQTSTFAIPEGVSIYGGFQNGEAFGEQNPAAHPTILDGGDTARHVVTISSSSITNQTKLSGFTITGGNATTGSSSQRRGGGVYIADDAQAVQITNCVFTGNAAEYGGGLLADFDPFGGPASVYIANCTFHNNSATNSGGGIAARGAELILMNCLFYENTAATGAALFSQNGGPINLVNSTVTDNSATSAGGGGYFGAEAFIANCIFWNNDVSSSTDEDDQLDELISGDITIQYSCIEGLSTFAGNGNVGVDPEFVDAANDDYRLSSTSGCINVGLLEAIHLDRSDVDYDSDAFEPTPDLDLNCRQAGGPVDLGAYEVMSDCDGDQIPDCEELVDNDCDNDGIPDDCELNSCSEVDCDFDDVIDLCQVCGADILFLIDTSASQVADQHHGDEVDDFCADVIDAVRTAANNVSGSDVEVVVFKLGNSPLTCDDETTTNLHDFFGTGTNPIPAPDPATGNDELPYTGPNANEEWGSATAILADEYPWRGNVRIIIPFSDEGPSNGDDLEFEDELSANRIISQANTNGVFVIPVLGHRNNQAVSAPHASLYTRIALSTSDVSAVILDNGDINMDDYSEAGSLLAGIVAAMVDDGLPCTEFTECGGCIADITNELGSAGCPDNDVNVFDLLELLANWAQTGTPGEIPGDIVDHQNPPGPPDGVVNVFDLLYLLSHWGPCSDPGQSLPQSEEDCFDKFYPNEMEALEACLEAVAELQQ